MNGRGLQIDVLGEVVQDKNIIICRLTIDGRDCRCLISRRDYEALINDNVFVRDGKSQDSANVWNTTRMFYESTF